MGAAAMVPNQDELSPALHQPLQHGRAAGQLGMHSAEHGAISRVTCLVPSFELNRSLLEHQPTDPYLC